MLYQLSYVRLAIKLKKGTLEFLFLEPIPGLEPGTHALRMRCSTN